MATFHSDRRLVIPPDADPDEAAAIAAAIERAIAAGDDEEPPSTWDGARWRFAARLEAVRGVSRRAPDDLPRSPWRAAARLRNDEDVRR